MPQSESLLRRVVLTRALAYGSTGQMRGAKSLLNLARSVVWRAFGVTVVIFFAAYALFGANGVLAWGDYSTRLKAHQTDLAQLQADRDQLAHRVALLDPNNANPDMVDELVRRDLGLARPDEVIIPLR
jgi:cell division protein FtsB